MTYKIRILLADDHPIVRQGICDFLGAKEDLTMVGDAANGYEAQRLCRQHSPDILLLDVGMPGPSAFDTVAYVRRYCPRTKVLILTAYDEDIYVRGLTAAGVSGYILKEEAPEKVVRAIRAVADGDSWFSQAVLVKLAEPTSKQSEKLWVEALSERERQILFLLAKGRNNKTIADRLSLAEQTVRNNVSRIYGKLDVETRAEAIVLAWESGLTNQVAL